MRLNYHLLDVFTERPFGGNPLAVFPDPPLDLSAELMQKIAAELNLSETTFVFPAADPAHDFKLRIFTPAAELPMAGHPTVGSAFTLARLGRLGKLEGQKEIVFEEGVGPIRVRISADGTGQPTETWMEQPIPRFLETREDREAIANLLSLSREDLLEDAPLQVLSSGLPFLYVVVKSLSAMKRISLRLDKWSERLAGSGAEQIFVTALETEFSGSTAHSRMFAPGLGIIEDPATGSASGPLGAYLLKYGLIQTGELLSEQGIEMGRPSFIHIRVKQEGGRFSSVAVGGACAYVGFGTLALG